jgi:hypothetical protein
LARVGAVRELNVGLEALLDEGALAQVLHHLGKRSSRSSGDTSANGRLLRLRQGLHGALIGNASPRA